MKIIEFGESARQKLLRGVETLAKAVSATLGAAGRNVMIGSDWQGAPHITKDGVTVARAIVMNDPIEEMGARMIKEAASKAASEAGDGTTTATVLAYEMIMTGILYAKESPKANMMQYKADMDRACRDCVEMIKKIAVPVDINSDDLFKIAKISASGDEYVAKVVSEAVRAIGKDGVISVERSGKNTMEIDVQIADGMEFSQGVCSTEFFNDKDRTRCNMTDCYVLVCQTDIVKFEEILPILKQVHGDNEAHKGARQPRGLMIIAQDVSGEALATLVVNKVKGNFMTCAVRSPGFGDMKRELLADIATVCGATVINEQNGLTIKTAPLSALGILKSVTAYKDKTILVSSENNKTQIDARSALLQGQIDASTNDGDKQNLSVRLARIRNGVAVLYVGGFTEVEMNERRDRIDDAICAVRSAMEEGIVAGGGVAYKKFFDDYINEGHDNNGCDCVAYSLKEPFQTILLNAGIDSPSYLSYPVGINVVDRRIDDMFTLGIIDPAKVCRVAIEAAVSVAGTFLTTECVIGPTIAKLPEKNG